MLQRFLLFTICLLLNGNIFCQDWVEKMNDPSVNFYEVQSSFNTYWKKEERKEKFKSFFTPGNKTEEENESFILYKRWENFVEPRVFPSGDRNLLNNNSKELEKTFSDHSYKSSRQAGGNWQPLGPFTVPTGGGGAGRLCCVRFHPTNPNVIFTGAPVGGLWISTNNGTGWTTMSGDLPTLGVNDVVVDPINPNVMYVATGDMDANDSFGVGVLKSTDAGVTWNITTLNSLIPQGRSVNRLLMNPDNHNMLFAGTSFGLFRSIDAGTTWVKVLTSTPVKDLEFKPGDPTVVYAVAGKTFYRSTNSGASFSSVTSGLPSLASVNRAAIAVTEDDPSYVYILFSSASDNGFFGVYRSTNSGTGFSSMSSSPNLLGWDTDGSDVGGQAWYTLSIAASPINRDEVIVGGVNIWKSDDGGASWNLNAHWYGGGGVPYVHADIHDLVYKPDGSAYYAACDGGIFMTQDGGASWDDLSDGLQIAQMYRLGCSATNSNLVIQGWQDNGTSVYNSGAWGRKIGGDGMECFIDWSNASVMYGEIYYGDIQRSTNGGASFSSIKNNIDEEGDWVTPWQQDPATPQTIYAAFKNVWKSTNRGSSWTPISTWGTTSNLKCLAVAPSNSNYIYVSNGSILRKTTDGGANWSIINYPLSGVDAITYITVAANNPDILWITRSGYSPDNRVYKSLDGGATWINLSAGLPTLPVNCIVSQAGTAEGVYVGTDVGVYYTDTVLGSWMPYSNGLPNVVVDELEIHYGSGKLRAATYGRGLWECSIFNPASALPFANFNADTTMGCPGLVVHFTDASENSPTSWNWSFPGGSPATSTLQNPIVTYNIPGHYQDVKLVVSNSSGADSVTKTSYIAISPQIQPTITLNNNDSICSGTIITLKSSQAQSYSWLPNGQAAFQISTSSSGTFSVTVKDVFGCTTTSLPMSIYVFPQVSIPTVTMNGDTLFSSASTGNQWYYNDSAISGAINQTYITTHVGGNYYVKVTDSVGICSATSSIITNVHEATESGVSYNLYPNPNHGKCILSLVSESDDNIHIEITDLPGRVVYNSSIQVKRLQLNETSIDLHDIAKGIYLLQINGTKGTTSKKIIID
jgi:PKD repeat protein/photosystem II stability/assembly factor-like uncharacterized protein